MDSGFEVLRFYKVHPELHNCKIVVWTVMGETQQALCKLFGVGNVLSKHDGEAPLSNALSKILERIADSAASN